MFSRLVVTRQQIDELRLPTAPPKETDRRSFNDTETVQAEAIPPDVLARIVQNAIDQRVNSDIYRDVLERETCIRQQLGEKLIPLLDEPWGDT
jgi:hypothetical protein